MRLTLEQVIERHGKSVYAAAYSLLRQREDAEDVLQDTLLRYHMSKQDFASERHLRAWLLRLAINRAKDLLKAARRRDTELTEDVAELAFPEPESRRVFEAVLALPESYRIVVHLHYYEDYSVREIAAALRLTQTAVKTRLSRARAMLRQTLGDESTEQEDDL